jgi:membrane-associated protease RseP (regulator of RpoE activity)
VDAVGAATILIGILLMIIIHEGGHFVAAKVFGMKATEAFVGFGPRLWSFRRGETEYGIKAIPLGGYVRIIGMNPFEEVDAADEGRTYRVAPFWQKSVVVLAGIVSHFVMAVILFAIVALAYGVVVTDEAGDVIPTTTIRAVSESVEIVSGETVPAPSSVAGVEPGDVVVAFNSTAIDSWEEFTGLTSSSPGESVVISVTRDGSIIPMPTTLAPVERVQYDDEGEPITDSSGEAVTAVEGYFGVVPEIVTEDPGLVGAFVAGVEDFGRAFVQSLVGLWQLVVNFPQIIAATFGGGDEVLDTVRPVSPIGLARIAGALESNLILLAIVNVFVGVLNLVPLYPLDGGHFAVALYEKIRGRTPDVRKLLPVAAAVFIFIVTIGLLGIYLDIVRPLQL